MDFTKLYYDTETSVKLEFLQSILLKNEVLRNQFLKYCKPAETAVESTEAQQHPREIIAENCEQLKDDLEALNFEDIDWEDYSPRHSGYIPEYEAMEHIAEDQLDLIFQGWEDEIILLVYNGQPLTAVCTILGAYDACLNADIPGSGDVFGDSTGALLGYHEKIVNLSVTAMKATVITGNHAYLAAETILNHYRHSYNGNKDFLKYFEPLLIGLAETKETADLLLQKIKSSGIEEEFLLQLVVHLDSFNANKDEWVKKASQHFMNDLNVAKRLLDYYLEHDVAAFLRDGKTMFAHHPDTFAEFLHERLTPEMDLDFFKKVLWHRAYRERNITLYEALSKYLDNREKQLFCDSILSDLVFSVKIFEFEKRFRDILELAQKEVQHTWHFPELITPILNIYPQEAFEMIRFKATQTIENERGRHSYERVCTWLKLAQQIKTREDDTNRLIQSLYNRKPPLPALKDEMRKMGVVR